MRRGYSVAIQHGHHLLINSFKEKNNFPNRVPKAWAVGDVDDLYNLAYICLVESSLQLFCLGNVLVPKVHCAGSPLLIVEYSSYPRYQGSSSCFVFAFTVSSVNICGFIWILRVLFSRHYACHYFNMTYFTSEGILIWDKCGLVFLLPCGIFPRKQVYVIARNSSQEPANFPLLRSE